MADRPPSYLSDPKGKVLNVSWLTIGLVVVTVIVASAFLFRWLIGWWTYGLGQ
jgi:hypothetical protein